MHGAAVAIAFPFPEGTSAVSLPPLEDELLLLELLELDEDSVQGGTISVVMLLLAGTTSWFEGVEPELACWAEPPPGVRSTVLAGGGEPLLLLELLLLELDELEEDMQGWIATVSVREPGGMTISFDPGGTLVLPDCATSDSEHGGTAMVSADFCLGTWTVRMPGSISAVDTASELELELLLLLLPHADSPRLAAAIMAVPTSRLAAALRIVIWSSPPPVTRRPGAG
jgi:hypothetical protein